ncbi:MAG: hypothetical protein UV73_C0014G0018 [Candidatus Gottesmanbacteria bacterium GW2011_GWA2_43_14]|uniref:Uncharacterized protein n=1 Tax=Candidatus Gottesmanbacteria bacterium GW2011_GWA2_43_14 TaxID=1618443 RepID=A0A0G1FL16_9BACT|nr:MAG: hypothetical protein UV73_C0014G0018 [Candidatus Gottesmanbacteria bacterium GW2011_GWA2_43_14]
MVKELPGKAPAAPEAGALWDIRWRQTQFNYPKQKPSAARLKI